MTANFYECIHKTLLNHVDDEMIIWPDQSANGQAYTGQAVLDRISAIQLYLSQRQVQLGQPVLLAIPVTFDLICTLLAIMAMGAVPVLPPAAPSRRTYLFLAAQGNLQAVVTQQELTSPLTWLAKRIGIKPIALKGMTPSASAERLPPQPVDPNQPALISHSSGSTGKPKTIRRSHSVLLAQHQALDLAFPAWPGQRDFPLFPNILLHNLATGTVSILPDLPGFNVTQVQPNRIIQQLVDQRIQTLTGNVYYFQKLLRHLQMHPQLLAEVRAVGIGGSPVSEALVHSLKTFFVRADLYVIYGSSEVEPIAVRRVDAEPQTPRAGYAVGTVRPSLRVRLRPLGTLTLPDGWSPEVGEIEVAGAHVAVRNNDWFSTGDFGYFDQTGQLVLTGRRGNERLHRGVQHYQIEHVLSSVKGVVRVAARALERGFAVYVEGDAPEAELWRVLTVNFPEGIVTHIYFRKNLPVDARHQSKIRYEHLT